MISSLVWLWLWRGKRGGPTGKSIHPCSDVGGSAPGAGVGV